MAKRSPPSGSAPARTDSGPADPAHEAVDHPAGIKKAEVQRLAAAMPHNALKAGEHGFDNGLQPDTGPHVPAETAAAGASTVSEVNGTDKSGSVAVESVNATIDTLDRVRVDASGRAMTTNLGMFVADNQNSLKFGVRGPALLEDFVLREKITHFDHERIPERIVHARV